MTPGSFSIKICVTKNDRDGHSYQMFMIGRHSWDGLKQPKRNTKGQNVSRGSSAHLRRWLMAAIPVLEPSFVLRERSFLVGKTSQRRHSEPRRGKCSEPFSQLRQLPERCVNI